MVFTIKFTSFCEMIKNHKNLPKIFGFTTIYHSGQPFLCIDGIHAGFISRCVGRGVESSGGILYYGPFRIDKATGALVDVALPGGRGSYADGEYRMDYYTTDHLGSVRVITDMDGEICQNPS